MVHPRAHYYEMLILSKIIISDYEDEIVINGILVSERLNFLIIEVKVVAVVHINFIAELEKVNSLTQEVVVDLRVDILLSIYFTVIIKDVIFYLGEG